MRRKLVVGTVVALAAVLGLWMSLGTAATAHTPKASTQSHVASVPAKALMHADVTPSVDTDNIQSGDQSAPDNSAAESESDSENGGSVETDNVDCQQDGQFEGVNAAGTGSGCDGTGT